MHTDTDYLKNIAAEIAAKPNQENQNTLPDKHLLTEANRLQKLITDHLLSIDNFPQRESFYFNTLSTLVDICDILFEIKNIISPDVKILLDLLAAIKKVLPSEISPKLKLPNAFIYLQNGPLTESCEENRENFKEQEIDPKLITIATIPFSQFTKQKHKLYWRNFTWLKGYQEKLETIDWENTDCNSKNEALMSLLINCDFNDDRFFIYCKKYILQRTNNYVIKKKRLAEFAECEKLILEDTYNEFPPYNHRRKNISEKLIDWIKRETTAIQLNDSDFDTLYKIEFNLDVDSIALFWKHLMDHGITKLVNVELYSRQIAATCSSKGKEEFKWETIKGKFYGKNPKYLKRIFDPLVAIIEDIKRFLKV